MPMTERDNFSRFGLGIVGTGTTMTQDFLAFYISPPDLTLKVKGGHPVWKRLNNYQKDVIRNARVDGYIKFDITLTYILLRNVCTNLGDPSKSDLPAPRGGWGKNPQTCDIAPSDDLERIRILRNTVYGHASQALMSESIYKKHWQELKEIACRMASLLNKDYERQLRELEASRLPDAQVEELLKTIDDENLGLMLCGINDLETKSIPVAPLQEAYKLPVELLYASVVITEDLRYTTRRLDSSPNEEKVINDADDIFTIGRNPAQCVYLIGDAARGKTTYCLWLLKHWCRVQQQRSQGELPENKWECYLSQFDLVFYLPLRRVDPSRVSVADMLCEDILYQHPRLHPSVRLKLKDDSNRCLIFIDGLDEWNPNRNTLDQLKCKTLPNFDNIANCVLFYSMRRWLFSDLVGVVRDNDRVLEIKGLDEEGMKTVTKNVHVHHHRLEAYTDEHKRKYDEFIVNLGNETLRSFLQIPLLAVVCIQVWYNGIQVGNSMTRFYTAMVNMLIERAHRSRDALKMPGLETFGESNIEVPNILSEYDYVEKSLSVLFKLGKVAYEGLLSNNTKLVFRKEMLERQIGEKELRFAFDVGLISKEEALSIETQNVRVRFFHQSVQEFLSVLYLVIMREMVESFSTKLSSVKGIMEMSNVIRFICGMSPSLGGIISQKVVNVTDADKEISQFRKTGEYNRKVEELYKLQISWYREIQCEHAITNSPVNFHVSDICLFGNSDVETVRITRDFLCHHHHDIRSLWLYTVDTSGERGISSTEMNAFLAKAQSMVMFSNSSGHICSLTNVLSSLKFLFLTHGTIDTSCLSFLPSLHRLDLDNVTLVDGKLFVSPDMLNIENIELYRIDMSSSGWQEFVRSLEQFKHRFVVKIFDSFTDRQFLTKIRNSHHFEVTRMTVNGRGRYEIGFIRKWPLTEYQV